MRTTLFRTLLLLPLLLGLAACDASADADGPGHNPGHNPGGTPGEQPGTGAVNVSGALQGDFSGAAFAGVDDEGDFAVYVQAGDPQNGAARGVLLYRSGGDTPEVGRTYTVGDPAAGGFGAAYYDLSATEEVFVEGVSGTFRVTRVTDTEVVGVFAFDGTAFRATAASETPESLGPATASGRFRARYVRERRAPLAAPVH